ncbi:phosphoglycerate mutase, 2,3-bisphosphoglycerate-independent [Methanosalsum zhilinae DSM 4017]|uniref:2,3-bisphosphoglycerate-independent phosphoglycerate mutase n=1 Tax=Methanosalsum zhilinae (strain DSM 4017 / NBRC 107636 / OCM 62 / WeN5) TaxID=679901 RepID=F7XKE4_METZD|nr:2,3-bisphosphoglycerate-independent phosphoglycerate mutase [Methanosalsum zhilinae]AEH61712.1 phosphoglycerate mutase, 2,3-bisphosphoglycerate-independent [Methanosalsum zhilinae DSM 4017]
MTSSETITENIKPLLLMILDGWGYSERLQGNALKAAHTPNLDRLMKQYPHTLLQASGEGVGLPPGQMGNSEVGHLNIGAGRIVYQDLTLINKSIESGDFYSNQTFLGAIENVKEHDSALHLMGLVSDGGVHSHIKHLEALIELADQHNIKKLYIHPFLDGRDVSPNAGIDDIQALEDFCARKGTGKIATVIGRYYAMDRDRRWERTAQAYDALTIGKGQYYSRNATKAVEESYVRGDTDEFVKPTIITDKNDDPVATIKDNDSVIFFNFRPDRARQLTYAFLNKDFDEFRRKVHPHTYFVCMTEYDKNLESHVAFSVEDIQEGLGETISKHNLRQLRISETEKYAHVTFFFNGGVEKKYEGEERCLIPSPKVSTYDLKPEMSAYLVKEEVIRRIESGKYDVIILNYANMDMVGHTGIFEAAVSAVEVVDECVEDTIDALLNSGGCAIITSDHGNVEQMLDPSGNRIHTAHTANPVPFIFVHKENKNVNLTKGKLADIAPTMLEILGISKPSRMTGISLLKKK